MTDYEDDAVDWLDVRGMDHEGAVRSIAKAQVYATLAVHGEIRMLRQELASLREDMEKSRVFSISSLHATGATTATQQEVDHD